MLNGNSIRWNARKKARNFVEQNNNVFLQKMLVNGEINQLQFKELCKSATRGAMKGAHVKFKKGNLTQIALSSANFIELQNLLSARTRRVFTDRMALEFLRDCLMVGVAFEFGVPAEAVIDDSEAAFLSAVDDLVFRLLLNLADEVEEFYLADVSEKTQHMALQLFQRDERVMPRENYAGKRPLETAMQTS